MEYLTGKEVQTLLKISDQTLRRYRNGGKLKFIRVNPKRYLYDKDEINKFLGKSLEQEISEKPIALYCRVSSSNQRDDLRRQKQLLKDYCNSHGYLINDEFVFSEIASGMNENREQFWKMINAVLSKKISKIFVTYKDRLTRFGFSYFEKIFESFGCQIVVLNNAGDEDNSEKEMIDDLISIIHHFSMKMYSSRRKKLKDLAKSLSGDGNIEENSN